MSRDTAELHFSVPRVPRSGHCYTERIVNRSEVSLWVKERRAAFSPPFITLFSESSDCAFPGPGAQSGGEREKMQSDLVMGHHEDVVAVFVKAGFFTPSCYIQLEKTGEVAFLVEGTAGAQCWETPGKNESGNSV